MTMWTVDRPGPYAKHMFGNPPGTRVLIRKTSAVGKTEMAIDLLGPRLAPERKHRDVLLVADEGDYGLPLQ